MISRSSAPAGQPLPVRKGTVLLRLGQLPLTYGTKLFWFISNLARAEPLLDSRSMAPYSVPLETNAMTLASSTWTGLPPGWTHQSVASKSLPEGVKTLLSIELDSDVSSQIRAATSVAEMLVSTPTPRQTKSAPPTAGTNTASSGPLGQPVTPSLAQSRPWLSAVPSVLKGTSSGRVSTQRSPS